MTNRYKEMLIHLINKTGGNVEDDTFVTDIGVSVLSTHRGLTNVATDLFEELRIDSNKSGFLQLSEFCARLTYLSFKDDWTDSSDFHDRMINDFGHLSPYSLPVPAVLVAGCTIETVLEFVAHHEAVIARLTSSKTKAMDEPLFRIQTSNINSEEESKKQREYIKKVLELHKSMNFSTGEFTNRLFPANKVGAFVIGMNIKDWHKTFIGRMKKSGVEVEVKDVCYKAIKQLRNYEGYNQIIKTASEYYERNNSEKYE